MCMIQMVGLVVFIWGLSILLRCTTTSPGTQPAAEGEPARQIEARLGRARQAVKSALQSRNVEQATSAIAAYREILALQVFRLPKANLNICSKNRQT